MLSRESLETSIPTRLRLLCFNFQEAVIHMSPLKWRGGPKPGAVSPRPQPETDTITLIVHRVQWGSIVLMRYTIWH